MGYSLLCIFSLSFMISISVEEPYMIRISGKPGKIKSSIIFDISWKECKVKCRTDVICVNTFNLNYKVTSCPNLMKLFQRGETTVVCIGLLFFEAPLCNNHAHASALCKAQKGTLTGPANADEYEYIQNVSNSSKYYSNPDSYSWLTFWIDGVSTNTEKVYTFEDPTHNGITNYQWTPGSPHLKGPGHCLHNPGPLNSYVQAIPCSDTVCTQCSVCWRGALCQVPPLIEKS